MATQPLCLLDEGALKETLEGIPHPECYVEIVYLTQDGLPETFTLKKFPAVRTIIKTPSHTIARLYLGAKNTTEEQMVTVINAYRNRRIMNYRYMWSEGEAK